MFFKVLLVHLFVASASFPSDEKVTVGFTCDELQNQRDTHEAKFESLQTAQWKFQITTNRGGWYQVREQCNDLGGDLIYHNLGPEGKQYHDTIRDMVSKSPHNLWVGLSDHGKEGVFRLMNGTKYDPSEKSVSALYFWEDQEPNGNDDVNCVHYWKLTNGFADTNCSWDYMRAEGVEDESIDLHGLCEIKSYNCLEEI